MASGEDRTLYLTPAKNVKPKIYDPLKDARQLVLDALNIGRLCMSKKPDGKVQKQAMTFALKYGLFGLMTALPTTPKFMEYENVYLPKNHFIKEETLRTEAYLALFFPFNKLDIIRHGVELLWNIQNDRAMMSLAMSMNDKPTIVWSVHSPLLGIQMMSGFMLTDDTKPLRLCKHCAKVFVASRPSNQFCSPECKNRYNVYKSRKKNKPNGEAQNED